MKKLLWMSLAALGFVACEKGIDDGNQQTGEMEQSYVAITLAATDVTTRATNGNQVQILMVFMKQERKRNVR